MTSRKWLLSAALLMATAMPAFADQKTEDYVRANANAVLASLNAPDQTAAERRVKFQQYMDEFANLDVIAKTAIGKYASRFTEQEMADYIAAFRAYALAVYEFYFNAYKGRDVKVTGSIDRNARDSIVDTKIVRNDGQELTVRWRVFNRAGKYQVMDVALDSKGNVIWLAVEQQAQFLSILDKSNGSAKALIDKINELTANVVNRRQDEIGKG